MAEDHSGTYVPSTKFTSSQDSCQKFVSLSAGLGVCTGYKLWGTTHLVSPTHPVLALRLTGVAEGILVDCTNLFIGILDPDRVLPLRELILGPEAVLEVVIGLGSGQFRCVAAVRVEPVTGLAVLDVSVDGMR